MRTSRKITYSAVSVALASMAILIGRFSPVRFVPLMMASVCFFMSLRCGLVFGIMSMAASMLLTFFWGSMDITILLVLLLFAPYSIAAYFMHGLRYQLPALRTSDVHGHGQNQNSMDYQYNRAESNGSKSNKTQYNGSQNKTKTGKRKAGFAIAVRVGVTVAIFNASLALVVFVFLKYAGDILIGFNPLIILDKVGMPLGYILLAIFGSAYMIGFDIMFVKATDILQQRLRIAARHTRTNTSDSVESDSKDSDKNKTDDKFIDDVFRD